MVGYVSGAHGVYGELKVNTQGISDFPEKRLIKGSGLFLQVLRSFFPLFFLFFLFLPLRARGFSYRFPGEGLHGHTCAPQDARGLSLFRA